MQTEFSEGGQPIAPGICEDCGRFAIERIHLASAGDSRRRTYCRPCYNALGLKRSVR